MRVGIVDFEHRGPTTCKGFFYYTERKKSQFDKAYMRFHDNCYGMEDYRTNDITVRGAVKIASTPTFSSNSYYHTDMHYRSYPNAWLAFLITTPSHSHATLVAVYRALLG